MIKRFILISFTSLFVAACTIPCHSPCQKPDYNFIPLPEMQSQLNGLCVEINAADDPHVVIHRTEGITKKYGISTNQWYEHYIYKYYCGIDDPLFYNVMKETRLFKALINEGLDLSHPVKGLKGEVTTLKDIFTLLLKQTHEGKRHDVRRQRLSTIYTILINNNAKSCSDMPKLPCGKPAKFAMHKAEFFYHRDYNYKNEISN